MSGREWTQNDQGVGGWKQPGGGSQPTTREEWSGGDVVLTPNSGEWLRWTSSGGPDALLDATDPAHPTVSTAGVYMVSIVARCAAGSSASYDVTLFLDRHGFNASQLSKTWADSVSGEANDVPIAFAWYIPAGGAVEVFAGYNSVDQVNATGALLIAHIQRLS